MSHVLVVVVEKCLSGKKSLIKLMSDGVAIVLVVKVTYPHPSEVNQGGKGLEAFFRYVSHIPLTELRHRPEPEFFCTLNLTLTFTITLALTLTNPNHTLTLT